MTGASITHDWSCRPLLLSSRPWRKVQWQPTLTRLDTLSSTGHSARATTLQTHSQRKVRECALVREAAAKLRLGIRMSH